MDLSVHLPRSVFVLIVSLPWITIVRFIVWLAIGLVIYFLYSRRSSHLQRGEMGPARDASARRDDKQAG